MAESYDGHPLPLMLDVAVPLWIARAQTQTPEAFERRLIDVVQHTSDVLAETGEAILFTTKRGQSAAAFNAVAEAIAYLSFCPGGIDLFGRHWESHHVRER